MWGGIGHVQGPAAYKGDTLTCTVTAAKMAGTSVAATAGVLVPYALPTDTNQPSITGTVAVGSTVTCDPGAWTGSPTYAYEWQDGGSTIAAATAPTYTVPLRTRAQSSHAWLPRPTRSVRCR